MDFRYDSIFGLDYQDKGYYFLVDLENIREIDLDIAISNIKEEYMRTGVKMYDARVCHYDITSNY